jgi:DNA-binding beta-propeller fold protein YncE
VNTKTGKCIRDIQVGQGHQTRGVAVHNGYVYVSVILHEDKSQHDDDGTPRGCVMKFGMDQVDSEPESYIGVNVLKTPDGLTIGPDGLLYVLDTTSHSVHVFGPDGKRRNTWGSYGQEPGQFHIPNSVALYEDWLYVSDWGNDRIQQFTLDGRFVCQWGSTGANNDQFCYPTGIAAHGNRVYVADCFNNRLQVFSQDGTFVNSFSGFSLPRGIAVCRGHVWVCNSLDRTVRRCR